MSCFALAPSPFCIEEPTSILYYIRNIKEDKMTEDNRITIEYLADHKQYIDLCASWAYGCWGCRTHGSFERSADMFQKGANKTDLPMTFIALCGDMPTGMISLWESDHDGSPDQIPWLASLYVHPLYRGKGIASLLIERLEKEAVDLGFKIIWLFTEDAEHLYEKNGFSKVETKMAKYGMATMMVKNLNPAHTD